MEDYLIWELDWLTDVGGYSGGKKNSNSAGQVSACFFCFFFKSTRKVGGGEEF